MLAVLVAAVAILTALAQSHWGLLLRAIRGDEASCQAAGINVTFYKIASLMISAAFAGLGGALYAHYQLQVSPPLFSVVVSITIIIMVYVGGIGSIYGPAMGAILLTLLTEMLRGFGEYRLWIYTLTLMLILFFLPNGLIAPYGGGCRSASDERHSRGHQRLQTLWRPHRREGRQLLAEPANSPVSSAPMAPARPRCSTS